MQENKNNVEMNKIAIYCRVSTDGQAERGTIDAQVDFARKFVDLHGLNVFDYYCDDGVTGMMPLGERPEGSRLLLDAKKGEFNIVYVYKVDRLGRSARETLNAIYELDSYGVTLRSLTEPFDMSTAMGQFYMQLLANMADLERNTFLERSRLGTERVARAGKWLGGIVPYGYYKDDDGYLYPNTETLPGTEYSECSVIQSIFQMMGEQQKSCPQISDLLNALNIPTSYSKSKGKRKQKTMGVWRPNAVRRIITNTIYKGVHYYGKRSKYYKTPIKREMPAIVSEALWDAANCQLDRNRRKNFREKKHNYLLSGLVKCGNCGGGYSGVVNNQGNKYYRCNANMNWRNYANERCDGRHVNGDYLEDTVWKACKDLLTDPEKMRELVTKGIAEMSEPAENYTPEINSLSAALNEKKKEKTRLIGLYAKGSVAESDITPLLDKVRTEETAIEKQLDEKLIAQHQSEIANTINMDEVEYFIESIRNYINACDSYESKRKIVLDLVDSITVYSPQNKKDPVKVSFVFHFNAPTFDDCVPAGTADIRADTDYTNINIQLTEQELTMPLIFRPDLEYAASNNRIYHLRRMHDLYLYELADTSGLSHASISNYENSGKVVPVVSAKKIQQAFPEHPLWFIAGYDTLPERTRKEKLTKARMYHGHTLEEMLQDLKISYKQIRQWYSGEKELTKINRYLQILTLKNNT